MGRTIPSTNARGDGTFRPASDCRPCLRLKDVLALDFAPILTPCSPRGTLYLMVVTCLLGMRIPVGPVSKRNPALSVKWSRHRCMSMSATAGFGPVRQSITAVPTRSASSGKTPGLTA
jgi:hypothetical protein